MKKILLFASALLLLFSCTEKPVDDPVKRDSIELSADSATFTEKADVAKVIVTSSGEWTLASETEYAWVTPSAFKGVDGDIVKFEVTENLEADREAVYTFTCGKAEAKYTIISVAGEKPNLVLVSEPELTVEYGKGSISIQVTAPNGYRSIKTALSEGADAWLHYRATLPGATENDATINYEYDALGGLDGRQAVITLSAKGSDDLTVTLTQNAKQVLNVEKKAVVAEMDGGEIIIPVISNVEYKVQVSAEGDGWLTYNKKTDAGESFNVTAADAKRSADITFTQTDAKAGVEPLSVVVSVSQLNAIIRWAANMNQNRIYPKWVNNSPSDVDYPQSTVECLIYVNEFGKMISTIMGVEGEFLLRFGDAGVAENILQVANPNGNNLTLYNHPFETHRWYHIACTFDSSDVTVYIDGVKAGSIRSDLYGLPLGRIWSIDEKFKGNIYRCWWYGYSYDQERTLNGMMTELRMWNRALTEEEINAPNHFYTVDPASKGLLAYWKFTEGEGNTIADKSTSKVAVGEPLYGELNIAKDAQEVIRGTEGIDWAPVALPDK